MNRAIELHDSTLVSIEPSGPDFIVTISPAYIHESTGSPGVTAGIGYWQGARVVLRGAWVGKVGNSLPSQLDDGLVTIGETHHANIVPLPLEALGQCSMSLILTDGSEHLVGAFGISIDLFGEPTGQEAFPGG